MQHINQSESSPQYLGTFPVQNQGPSSYAYRASPYTVPSKSDENVNRTMAARSTVKTSNRTQKVLVPVNQYNGVTDGQLENNQMVNVQQQLRGYPAVPNMASASTVTQSHRQVTFPQPRYSASQAKRQTTSELHRVISNQQSRRFPAYHLPVKVANGYHPNRVPVQQYQQTSFGYTHPGTSAVSRRPAAPVGTCQITQSLSQQFDDFDPEAEALALFNTKVAPTQPQSSPIAPAPAQKSAGGRIFVSPAYRGPPAPIKTFTIDDYFATNIPDVSVLWPKPEAPKKEKKSKKKPVKKVEVPQPKKIEEVKVIEEVEEEEGMEITDEEREDPDYLGKVLFGLIPGRQISDGGHIIEVPKTFF